MLTLLTGENSFEIDRALRAMVSEFNGAAEKYDGAELTVNQLPDLLTGATLFSDERLVIIKNLSENKQLWEKFDEWIERVGTDVQVVLVEPKPDKRTKTYKQLAKHAVVQEYKPWSERDTLTAQKWVMQEAEQQGMQLSRAAAEQLVRLLGTDQWELYHAISKLSVLDDVTPELVAELIDAQPSESVFNLFEAALQSRSEVIRDMLRTLELTEAPYMVLGLVSGQAFQLVALIASDKPSAEVAKDIGAHPFAVSKLSSYAKKRTAADGKKIIAIFAEADDAIKTGGSPWLMIERALMKVAVL